MIAKDLAHFSIPGGQPRYGRSLDAFLHLGYWRLTAQLTNFRCGVTPNTLAHHLYRFVCGCHALILSLTPGPGDSLLSPVLTQLPPTDLCRQYLANLARRVSRQHEVVFGVNRMTRDVPANMLLPGGAAFR